MKTLTQLFTVILCFSFFPLNAQVTLDIHYYDNRNVDPNLYGFHMSNFFERCLCYDPVSPGPADPDIDLCMQMTADMQPRVLRFPAGGEHKFMHLLDDNGYGRRDADITEFLAKGWIDSTAAESEYYNVYFQDSLYDGIRFLDRFINFLEFCEDENGYKPKVIFVANILLIKLKDLYIENATFREIEHENMEVMRYLIDHGVEIVGIEMGNEHYDDKKVNNRPIFNDGASPPKLSFNDYFQTCKYLIDSIHLDTMFDNIPISLIAAPEPIHGENTGIGTPTLSNYKKWNTALKDSAQSVTASVLFDAYTVHIYNRPDDMLWCYNSYYEDYYSTNPDYVINLTNDDDIIPAWECAQDSFRTYTNTTLRNIMNQWAGSCDSCLDNDKPYWITEWGQFGQIEVSNFTEGDTTYNYTGDFSNTFIDAAYAFQFLLEMTDYDAGLGGAHFADVDYMIKHNYMSNSLGGAINPPVGIDDTSNAFIRRANYWPFFMMQDI